MNYTNRNKAIALMNHLKDQGKIDQRKEFIEECEQPYDENTFEINGNEYLVLDDSEATDLAEELIDSLLDECVLNEVPEELKHYFDRERFTEDCIRIDGRGHTISSYDGEEHEQGNYYIYRTN